MSTSISTNSSSSPTYEPSISSSTHPPLPLSLPSSSSSSLPPPPLSTPTSPPPLSSCISNNRGNKHISMISNIVYFSTLLLKVNPLDHPLQPIPRVPIFCSSHSNPLKTTEVPIKGYTLSNIKVYLDSIPYKCISENQTYLRYESNTTTTTTTTTTSATAELAKASTSELKRSPSLGSSFSLNEELEISVADLLQPPSNLNDFSRRPELSSILKSPRLSKLSATLIDLIYSEQTLHNSTAKLIRTLQRDDPQFLHLNYGPLEKQAKENAYSLYGATGEIMDQLEQAREGIAALLHQRNYLWKLIQSNAKSNSHTSASFCSTSNTPSAPSSSSNTPTETHL